MEREVRLVFENSRQCTGFRTTQGWCCRPILPVRLHYGEQAIDIDATIDTAADFSTFQLDIAKSLEIPEEQLILDAATTVTGKTKTWYCPIGITIMNKTYQCRAAFIDNPEWMNVIGRETIFSKIKFAFRESVKEFYLSFQP